MSNLYHASCLGVVLAGGLSSRMGKDKALLARNSAKKETMLDYSQQQLKKAGLEHIVISGQQHGLPDKVEKLGPMGGIYSVIEHYKPQSILVLPVDLPLIDHHCLTQLKLTGELSQKACFFQDNYLPLYLPITAFVEQFFNNSFSQLQHESTIEHKSKKGPSIRSLMQQIPTNVIKSKNKQSLFNANTPSQWQQAQSQFTTIRKSHV